MKVCKKCKSHVANKAIICKKCGSDVSKAKIIKNSNNTKNSKNTKPQIQNKKKTINNKKTPIVENKSKNKKEVVVTKKQNIKTQKDKLIQKQDTNHDKIKKVLNKILNILKDTTIKTSKIIKKITIYLGIELLQSFKTTGKITYDINKEIGKFIISLPNKTIKFGKKILLFIKNNHKKIEQKKINKPKKIKLERQVKVKVPEVKIDEQNNKPKAKRSFKYAFISVFVISIIGGVYFVGQDIYKDLTGTTSKVVVTEKATREKVFSMEDIITYNNIDYKIVKIETSNGNNYKTPKAGHQFLIVTVYIKNNSGAKAPYSYENWTMSNSRGEEKKRIFTSINVDTALYSGELVIGGIKTGSMVFEQPINDPKLKMNFYELKKDEDGNEVIDQAKRIFSISVKNPNGKKKTKSIKEANEDTKIVKNNSKDKS